ncbi:MAG: glycosyltransferase family 4 protein [Candidatus Bathyarchaeia archaeon]
MFKAYSSCTKNRIAYLSTYPPNECGIATFTKNIVESVDKLGTFNPSVIIAIHGKEELYNYDQRVKWVIIRDNISSYVKVAEQVNASKVDVINLQHEFGLYGGDFGEYILHFLDTVEKPVVTTLHTVNENIDPRAIVVLKKIVKRSAAVVVIASPAIKILEKQGILPKMKAVIPHGCPEINPFSSNAAKESLGLDGRLVMTTFGLLSRGKGIEYAIEALPQVVDREPTLVYLVIGETHPQVRKQEGERYRNKLVKLVEDLGLEEHVRFQNRYLTKRELIKCLQATDIYITPYICPNQISSGTLAYAVGAGTAIISTPYLHAKEVLSDNRGLFANFEDPYSIANCIKKLLDENIRKEMSRKNYEYSRRFTWPNIAMEYSKLYNKVSIPKKKTTIKPKKERPLLEFALHTTRLP